MKHCCKCETIKPRSEFNVCRAKKDGLQTRCRECSKLNDKLDYVNTPKRREKLYIRRDAHIAYNRRLTDKYKSLCGCVVCKENCSAVLDFHHLDADTKENNPSGMVAHATSKLKSEIRKCVVLCANCHRKLHAGLLYLLWH